jgi:hypothetical protein
MYAIAAVYCDGAAGKGKPGGGAVVNHSGIPLGPGGGAEKQKTYEKKDKTFCMRTACVFHAGFPSNEMIKYSHKFMIVLFIEY